VSENCHLLKIKLITQTIRTTSDRHVLTAAHCTMNYKVTDLYVRLGEYDFTRYNETRARDFRVMEIRQHADFDATTLVSLN
jgi:uncharacterized protein with GYD domain